MPVYLRSDSYRIWAKEESLDNFLHFPPHCVSPIDWLWKICHEGMRNGYLCLVISDMTCFTIHRQNLKQYNSVCGYKWMFLVWSRRLQKHVVCFSKHSVNKYFSLAIVCGHLLAIQWVILCAKDISWPRYEEINYKPELITLMNYQPSTLKTRKALPKDYRCGKNGQVLLITNMFTSVKDLLLSLSNLSRSVWRRRVWWTTFLVKRESFTSLFTTILPVELRTFDHEVFPRAIFFLTRLTEICFLPLTFPLQHLWHYYYHSRVQQRDLSASFIPVSFSLPPQNLKQKAAAVGAQFPSLPPTF